MKKLGYTKYTAMLNGLATISLWLLFASSLLAGERVTYYHTDAVGSVVAATDESGDVLWRETYRPYGERITRSVTTDDHALFYTGKPHDDVMGLSYFGARYYDPRIGRFISVDPVDVDPANPHSFSRYAYANNNPYRYVDPDGNLPVLAPLAVFAVKELAAAGFERATGLPALFSVKGAVNALGKNLRRSATKRGGDFVDGYRAVSKAEADDIAKHGFRPDPSGRSMQDKWFSESRKGAEQFRETYSDLTEIIHTKVPKNVYDRSFKHSNIDNTGPGFCVQCSDLPLLPKP